MDLFNLILRLVAFGISLIILLEFIVVCNVKTSTALVGLMSVVIIVAFGFIYFKRYKVSSCSTCNHIINEPFLKKIKG